MSKTSCCQKTNCAVRKWLRCASRLASNVARI